MGRFIPVDKIKQLREASKSGDERARKILSLQLGGKEDFSGLLDEYFAPKPEITEQPATESVGTGLQQFLQFNGINKDSPDYQSFVDDYYKENPNEPREEEHCECECVELIKKLMKEELDAIDSYSKGITAIMASEEIEEGQKRKIISRFNEIKNDENQHYTELKELLGLCGNKNDNDSI